VSLAKRDLDGADTISVSEDLQVSVVKVSSWNTKLECF
jgi:hypothetical protein